LFPNDSNLQRPGLKTVKNKMQGISVFLCALLVGSTYQNTFEALEEDQDLTYWQQEGWVKLHRVEPESSVHLTFALKQENVDDLEELLLKVSDPDSPSYGKYLSVDQITNLISPTKETVDIVKVWLKNNGVNLDHCDITLNKDFLLCAIPRKTAEKVLLGSVFHYYKHDKLSSHVIRSDSRYYIPTFISQYLDFVGGVHRFPNVNFIKTKQEPLNVPTTKYNIDTKAIHVGVYPKVLRTRYNLTEEDVGSHPDNSQVVAQFLEQFFSQKDLAEFMSMFVGHDFVHKTQIDKIIGPNEGRSGVEASLDTQYIMGLGANITTWFWATGGRHEKQEPFLQWLIDVSNTTKVPYVHSVSYGDDEVTLSTAYMKRVSTEFMKTGVRGITILFASGDNGAGCKKGKFSPNFPVSSPYVTGVGGTGFNNPFGTGPEFAYEISGGGFSSVFKQPAYQADKVNTFLNSTDKLPPDQYYNKTGRAYPDLAALSRHFWIVNNRIPAPGIAGTSAATPTVAGIISMLNEHRLHNNKPVMGFLNPFLYKNSQAMFDVTSGCNEGCLSGDKGFCATAGFDPVTGNGTPNYPALVKAAMQMFK